MLSIFKSSSLSLIILIGLLAWPSHLLWADTISDLQNKVADFQSQRQKLAEEIAALQKQLLTTKTQSASLKNEIAKIELTRSKLAKEIQKIQVEIKQAGVNINQLAGQITDKKERITANQISLEEILRSINHFDRIDLLASLLTKQSLADWWAQFTNLDRLQSSLDSKLKSLLGLKQQLEVKKTDQEITKKNLDKLENQLADQKKIADVTKKTKDDLLSITKNKEVNYQKLLADRLAKMKKVQEEIDKAESDLNLTVNPSLLPKTGTGALSWPLDKIIITQNFGLTAFAKNNTTLYGGRGHNGVDFGTSVGTVVKSARSGVVLGTGDTDKVCKGASYGRWILIQHDNGLTTLYAHLSLIKVSTGQSIETGQTIAYSGNTGYSTGPHLHFTVYASDGVKIGNLVSKVPGCGTYNLPLGTSGAYLNPLSYLPAR
ncbi:hypothetical protein BK005_00795 [bacterium CG10_37_50]|nr:MAG: hypothetical protein BK005_00795 [bacterium CG10_37_50]